MQLHSSLIIIFIFKKFLPTEKPQNTNPLMAKQTSRSPLPAKVTVTHYSKHDSQDLSCCLELKPDNVVLKNKQTDSKSKLRNSLLDTLDILLCCTPKFLKRVTANRDHDTCQLCSTSHLMILPASSSAGLAKGHPHLHLCSLTMRDPSHPLLQLIRSCTIKRHSLHSQP